MSAGRSSLLRSVAIYISVLRIKLFPPLVATSIEITPILEVIHNMARCHQMSVIGHTLSTNERYPVDSPFIETETNYDDFLISKILALAQRRQYTCHIFGNLVPIVLAGFIQRESLFNNVTQLFFNIVCLHIREAAIANFVYIFDRAFPVARCCVATQSKCVHMGLKSLYVFYSLCFSPTCELVKGACEQQCQ
jgi:hypothetical protein